MDQESDIARQLRSAQGYIELGMLAEAGDELERIAPEDRGRPAVLAYRYAIYSKLKKWMHEEEVPIHSGTQADPSGCRNEVSPTCHDPIHPRVLRLLDGGDRGGQAPGGGCNFTGWEIPPHGSR